jgi:hypothetical protein
MEHLDIQLKQTGDMGTALSIALSIAKCLKVDNLLVELRCGKSIGVSQDSKLTDLCCIADLEEKLLKAKP